MKTQVDEEEVKEEEEEEEVKKEWRRSWRKERKEEERMNTCNLFRTFSRFLRICWKTKKLNKSWNMSNGTDSDVQLDLV